MDGLRLMDDPAGSKTDLSAENLCLEYSKLLRTESRQDSGRADRAEHVLLSADPEPPRYGELPQNLLVEKAWQTAHPEKPGTEDELREASALFEEALELTSKVDLRAMKITGRELMRVLDATENDNVATALVVLEEIYDSVLNCRFGYALTLSAYGKKNNDASLALRALSCLNEIEKKDPVAFRESPDFLGAYLQLKRGDWIDQINTLPEAYAYRGIEVLKNPQAGKAERESALSLLVKAIRSNPELLRARIDEACKSLMPEESEALKRSYAEALVLAKGESGN